MKECKGKTVFTKKRERIHHYDKSKIKTSSRRKIRPANLDMGNRWLEWGKSWYVWYVLHF